MIVLVWPATLRKLGIQFKAGTPGKMLVKAVAPDSFGCVQGVQEEDELLGIGDSPRLDAMDIEQLKPQLSVRPLRLRFASSHSSYRVAAFDGHAKLGITFHGMPPGFIQVKSITEGLFGNEKGVKEGDVLMKVGTETLQCLEDMSAEVFKSFLKDRPLKMRFAAAQSMVPVPPLEAEQKIRMNRTSGTGPSRWHGRSEYTIVASPDTGKLGITFHGMPPGRIEVKGVASGLFGSTSGVQEGDALIEVGTDNLQALEHMSAETFKGLLKDRPLKMKFLAKADHGSAPAAESSGSSQHEVPPGEAAENAEHRYTIVAGAEVGELGITFNGMPPGRIDIKGLVAGCFGSACGVQEGDVLLAVGNNELLPLEGMSPDMFENLLRGRPLKMKFQSATMESSAASRGIWSPTGLDQQMPHGRQKNASIAQESRRNAERSEYTIVASPDTGKLGITFHGMPPGRIEVKGVASGLFGSTSGVQEGDALIEAGTDNLQALEHMSAETFKGLLKDRPLKMKFLAKADHRSAPAAESSGSSQHEVPPGEAAENAEHRYTIVAGAEVGKLGITFNGMPPGRIDIKGLVAGCFGSACGVQEGDVLLAVGNNELLPLEGMSPDMFENLLRGRPLKMKFQSATMESSAASRGIWSPTGLDQQMPHGRQKNASIAQESRRNAERSEYTIVASPDTGKLGITFHGMPPGRIEVKGVASGLFGSTSGVQEGDALIEVGTDNLQALEHMSAETFKGLLKDRPLKMKFLAKADHVSAPAAESSGSSQHEVPPGEAAENAEHRYTIVAGAEVGKLGITFNGMPPGRIDIKGLVAGCFGSACGVQEGDVLLAVGNDELLPLEGMRPDMFENLLRGRPLKMKFQSATMESSAASRGIWSPTGLDQQMPHGRQKNASIAQESRRNAERSEYTIVASPDTGKLGITFHGMPPGRIEVKGVASGLFGSTSGVQEGDALIEVGTDNLQALEHMSAETFKGLLKDRPLKMKFLAKADHGSAPAAESSGSSQHEVPPGEAAENAEHRYTIVAGAEVGKLGITFNGMPPGRIDIKGLVAGCFGSACGVQEGDVLLAVGNNELLPLEGMSPDMFENLLRGRPLKMKFQSATMESSAASRGIWSPTGLDQQMPHGRQKNASTAQESRRNAEDGRSEYTIVASPDTGKLGITFHGMPPGRIEVKGVASGLFGSTSGVQEGDALIEVGTDNLQALEHMSAETFKGLLKDRPLQMKFVRQTLYGCGILADQEQGQERLLEARRRWTTQGAAFVLTGITVKVTGHHAYLLAFWSPAENFSLQLAELSSKTKWSSSSSIKHHGY